MKVESREYSDMMDYVVEQYGSPDLRDDINFACEKQRRLLRLKNLIVIVGALAFSASIAVGVAYGLPWGATALFSLAIASVFVVTWSLWFQRYSSLVLGQNDRAIHVLTQAHRMLALEEFRGRRAAGLDYGMQLRQVARLRRRGRFNKPPESSPPVDG